MVWYRVIDPISEFSTLSKREKLSRDFLRAQTPVCPSDYNPSLVASSSDPLFTHLSAFHYYSSGIKQRDFASYNKPDRIGIILNVDSSNPRNVFWRDGTRSDVSDKIFKESHTVEKFKKLLKEINFVECSEKDVSKKVQEAYLDLYEQYKREKLDVKSLKLPWTEGTFRYKAKEIIGIVVQKDRPKSYLDGYNFAKKIEGLTGKKVRFYYYDVSVSDFKEISRDDIKALCLKPVTLAHPASSFVSKVSKSDKITEKVTSHVITVEERRKARSESSEEYYKNRKGGRGW